MITEFGLEYAKYVIAMLATVGAYTMARFWCGHPLVEMLFMWGVALGEWMLGMIPGWIAGILGIFSVSFCFLVMPMMEE